MNLSRRSRWAVPAAGIAVVAATLTIGPRMADAAPSLPPRTAAELLASTQDAVDHPFSGTVVETARLGLPDLPTTGNGGSTSLSPAALVTGSHTAKVWYASPERTRIALIGELAETDVIRTGRDVYTWSSVDNKATHVRLPAQSTQTPEQLPSISPDQAAKQALAAIDPTTAVSVEGTASIAGRSAYELVLKPRDTESLVAQVRLAIDSVTSTPLRVEVFAKGGSKPAFETTFTSITFKTPPASMFAFKPPAGATVTERVLPAPDTTQRERAPMPTKDHPTVVGSGWTSVVVMDGVDLSAASSPELSALLRSADRVSGSYGSGRVLKTALVSVLLLDDGRLLVGSVTPAVLERAAAATEK